MEDTWFEEGGLQILPLTSCYVIVKAYHRVLGWAHTRGHGNPPLQWGPISSCHIKVNMSYTHYWLHCLTSDSHFLLCWIPTAHYKQMGLAVNTERLRWMHTIFSCANLWKCQNKSAYCETLDHLWKEIRIYVRQMVFPFYVGRINFIGGQEMFCDFVYNHYYIILWSQSIR